jgi:transposase
VLAQLARTRLGAKRARLEEAFVGRFGEHHAFLLSRMLSRIDQASADIAAVEARIEAEVAPFAQAVNRLDEITGVGRAAAQVIIAEIGVDMSRFPTPGHLVSWARFGPGVKESAGRRKGNATTGHGNPYLARVLGEAAVAASKTHTFLGERYRRIARRRGAKRAIVAAGRSILIIIWHLLSDPDAHFQDLGPGFYDTRIDAERRKRNHVRQLEASATRSRSNPSPNGTDQLGLDPAALRSAGCCRLPAYRRFSD